MKRSEYMKGQTKREKNHTRVLPLVTLPAILVGFAATVAYAQEPSAQVRVRTLNNQVLQLHEELSRAARGAIGLLRSKAAGVFRARQGELRALTQQDPGRALSLAFSPELLADLAGKFPDSAGLLESHGTWQGPVEYWIIDGADLRSHRTLVQMNAGGETLEVHFAGAEPSGLQSGDTLAVEGVRSGNMLVAATANILGATGSSKLSAAGASIRTAAASATCSTTGMQNTAVLLVTFPGVTPPSNITPQSVYDMFFSATGPSLDHYWREVSYGQTSAAGDVYGWYTLDSSYANCGRMDLLRDAAITAAGNAGVNFLNYNRIFIVATDFGCGWTGMSLGGCITLSSPGGSFFASTSFLNASWQRSQQEGAQNATHEGGHNMGLAHAQSRTFGTEPLGPLGEAGTVTEYGDPFSDMACANIGHYAAPHKAELLNWISSDTNYQVVQTGGAWTLQPLEVSPSGLVGLKVQRGTGNNAWLWIEYRQAIGIYDSTIWPPSGALIHYEDSTTGGHTQLLDFTPGTSSMYDSALMPGDTWVDPYTNVSITVQSATANGLTVDVNYGATPCTHANPTVSLSPSNPSVSAGASVDYTVSVTNNDAAGCASGTFNLTSSQPSGWPATFSATSLALNPGETGAATLTITVPAGTTPATYQVDAGAANGTFAGTASSNCTVVTPPSLSATLSVPATAYAARQTVSMTATATNGSTPVEGASVTFTMTKANGAKSTKKATTDSTGKAVWNYRIGPKDPRGAYSGIADVRDASRTATTNEVSFTVQ